MSKFIFKRFRKLFPFLLYLILLSAAQRTDKLKVIGIIRHDKKDVIGAVVNVYSDSRILYSEITDRSGKFTVEIPFQDTLLFEVVKKNFIPLRFLISTNVKEKYIKEGRFNEGFYDLELEIERNITGLDISFFDQPVMLYRYNDNSWFFERDLQYEKKIEYQRHIDDLTSEKEVLKRELFIKNTHLADSLFSKENFESALLAYLNAEHYLPQDRNLNKEIRVTRKLIRNRGALEKKYENTIAQAEFFLAHKRYDEADQYFKKALIYDPEDDYAAEKLIQIDSLINLQFVKVVEEVEIIAPKPSIINNIQLIDTMQIKPEVLSARQPDTLQGPKDYDPDNQEMVHSHFQDSLQFATNKKREDEKLIPTSDYLDISLKKIFKEDADFFITDGSVFTGKQLHEAEWNDSTKKLYDSYLQDLDKSEKLNDPLQMAAILKNIGDLLHGQNHLKGAIDAYRQSIDLNTKLERKDNLPGLYSELAVAYYDSGAFELSATSYKRAILLSDSLNKKESVAELLTNLAIVYETISEHEKAIDYYHKGLEIKREFRDTIGISFILDNIGDAYLELKKPGESIRYYQQSLGFSKTLNNLHETGNIHNKLGIAYQQEGNYEKAIQNYEKALEINRTIGDNIEVSMSLNNIGNVNYSISQYKDAIDYYEQSLRIKTSENYLYGEAVSVFNMGFAYYQMNKFDEAVKNFYRSLQIAKANEFYEIIYRNYFALSMTYETLAEFGNALKYYKLYARSGFSFTERDLIAEKGTSYNASQNAKMVKYLKKEIRKQKLIAEYETAQKQQELQIKTLELQHEQDQKKRLKTFIFIGFAFTLVILILTFVLYRQNKLKQKANKDLNERNELIRYQQNQITDSIKSARRIQNATVLPVEIIADIFSDYFLINLPRDIVSGDFYWMDQIGEMKILAVTDCTGHGVPGAIMSMLGVAYLNETIHRSKKISPARILDELREKVLDSLHKTGKNEEAWDGMDTALITIHNDLLTYAGANSPIYIVRDGNLIPLKPNRMPIGFSLRMTDFKETIFDLRKGDMIYLFSDGIIDQLGGESGKRYLMKRFASVLENIASLPLDEQKDIILKAFMEWRGDKDQTDDILIFGIRHT